jgi:hypothetical protein
MSSPRRRPLNWLRAIKASQVSVARLRALKMQIYILYLAEHPKVRRLADLPLLCSGGDG